MTNVIKKIWENKVLSLFVLALILICSFYGCKSVIAHADESNEPEASEVAWASDEAVENSNDEAPLEAYGYKEVTTDEESGEEVTTLVLTYDSQRSIHASGQEVYNIPTAATKSSDYEWYSNRSARTSFTKVKVDPSFKDYTGLNSTAWMFAGQINVSSYEGFENFNFSNVVDSSYMFWEFGKEHSFECLDLSTWDTSNIKNYTFMLARFKLVSVKVGPKFNLDMSAGGAGLTNTKGIIADTWHDDDGNVYENASFPKTRDVVATYYDHKRLCAYAYKASISEYEDILVINYDTKKDEIPSWQCEKYEFPSSVSSPKSWGWNVADLFFTKIIINENFKNYSGLTSAAYMFYNLRNVNDFEGFENINTSNIDNMEYMFYNFGCNSPNLNKVPNVSNWDTSKVKSMTSMFENYGSGSNVLGEVPDVSNWNLSNTTCLARMFKCYASRTQNLNAVPNVAKWNTSNVDALDGMFQNYGFSSLVLNVVPHVLNWDTSKVKNMESMFEFYGAWSENALNQVPNVSRWNTSSLKRTYKMFYRYGNPDHHGFRAFENIDFSNWDTSNITDRKEYDYMLEGLYLRSITLGPGWDLKLLGGNSVCSFHCHLTNSEGVDVYQDDAVWWYDCYGTSYKGATFDKDKRTAPATYYDSRREIYGYVDKSEGQTSLVLTYDDQISWHRQYGYTVYEINPSANQPGDLQWNKDRELFTKVTINDNFKNCTWLQNTAYMFYNFKNVTEFDGFENIDTSNVKNMSHMFDSFASNCTTINSVPNVWMWNTSKATNMSSMFYGYGYNSEKLYVVPDVTNWNTSNVTNMTSMFNGYGKHSKELNTVPNVAKWDTSKVTNMSDMFYYYGEYTEILNKVPDVSLWHMSSVDNMANMFEGYAFCSLSLDLVPNVSKWDTSKVVDMSCVFSNYGRSSTKLTTSPDVSKWCTSKVTTMTSMFKSYGHSSVVSNLDLSNWDTTNIADSEHYVDMLSDMKLKSITLGSKLKADLTIPRAQLTNSSGQDNATWYDSENKYEKCSMGEVARTVATTYTDDKPLEPYAYETTYEYNYVLVLVYDNKKYDRVDKGYTVYRIPDVITSKDSWTWDSVRGKFEEIKIDASFNNYKGLKNTSFMFSHFENVVEAKGFENIDTSNVTDMSNMFSFYASSPKYVKTMPNVSNWDTSNVTNLNEMFKHYGYRSTVLAAVPNVSSWNTQKVTTAQEMFSGYGFNSHEITTIPDITKWNISSLANTAGMLANYCVYNIFSIDLSSWDTTNISKYDLMLENVPVSSITLGTKFNLNLGSSGANLTNSTNSYRATWYDNAGNTYKECGMGTLQRPEITTYYDKSPALAYGYSEVSDTGENTLVLKNDDQLYKHKEAGQTLYAISEYNGNKGTWAWDKDRKYFTKVKVDETFKNYDNLTSTEGMFCLFEKVTDIEGFENINTSNVTDMSRMFEQFGNMSKSLDKVPDVSKWDTSKVENMSNMFSEYCYYASNKLDKVPDVSNWNTSKVTNMSKMFHSFGPININSFVPSAPNVSKWDTSKVADMSCMFSNYAFTSTCLNSAPDVSKWDTSNVTNMSSMFDCYGFSSSALDAAPNVSNWFTQKVTTTESMFNHYGYYSSAIKSAPDVSKWLTSNIENTSKMFACYSVNNSYSLDLSSWETTKDSNYSCMLQDMKVKSIRLGSRFNINLSNSGACLTNSAGKEGATWYDKAGKKYENCGFVDETRTEAKTYYDCPQKAESAQTSVKSSDMNKKEDTTNNKDNSIDKRRQKAKV